MAETIGVDILKKYGIKPVLSSPNPKKSITYRILVYQTLLNSELPINAQEISRRTNISVNTVKSILFELLEAGLVDRYPSGMAWQWYIKKKPQETPKEEVKSNV
jgi:predicted transcriptional regulator